MKTHYRYIKITKVGDLRLVMNAAHGDVLGGIVWHAPWRQYCFCPTLRFSTIYSAGCLIDIADFLKVLNLSKRSASSKGYDTGIKVFKNPPKS